MTFTPAALASSAAAAAPAPSCGQMTMTLAPDEIRDSTLAFSLAVSPWEKRIWVGMPAVLKAASNLVWSWIQRGSSLVGRTTPIWTWANAMDPTTTMDRTAIRRMEKRFIRDLLRMNRAARRRARYAFVSKGY